MSREWVPVSEGLPENKVVVLLTTSTGGIAMGYCNRNSNNQWRDYTGFVIFPEPIAWQQLPEPYKEASKDAE